jgi:hypothetical protein
LLADFLRYYGLDLRDLFRGELSPKRALALVEGLPTDSAYAISLRGVEHIGWDRQAYILADLFDAVMTLIHITIRANTDKPKAVKEPGEYPRPGQKKSKQPDILLARLRGEEIHSAVEAGPGMIIPLPPS